MRYAIWTNNEDFTGFEANTIEEAVAIIYNEFWWSGVEYIIDTEVDKVVLITYHTDCSVGYADMIRKING